MPGQRPLDTKAPPQEQDTIIQVRDVVFHRGHKVIFDGLSLDIERGKVTAIMTYWRPVVTRIWKNFTGRSRSRYHDPEAAVCRTLPHGNAVPEWRAVYRPHRV